MSAGRKDPTRRQSCSPQLSRQWAILRLLESRAYSIRELADEVDASKSTIQRDLATLQQHFMIVADFAGQQKRVYRLERNRAPQAVRIERAELRALDEAIAQLGDGSGEALRRLRNKLHAFISQS